jgi:hypothetical protein
MMDGDREGLIARIRQVSRVAAARARPQANADQPWDERLRTLAARLAHLEQQVQGLQDSVHRESARRDKLIAELQTRAQPGAMGAALADDARQRGL